ncbi:MAG TPA: type II toxin-antitoxin system VapC family toxin [Pyrinomonadaceae bacterium]|nr:type II toxin-antitoxin system VapC family toxin [Pyrinomonadaceae bacterium]
MSDCITDTHGLIWYILNSSELSLTAKNLFISTANSGGNVFVPTISLVEITYLIEKNKFQPALLSRIISRLNNPNAELKPIGLTVEIADSLSQISRTTVPDMPDRIIAATALHLNLPLVTKDHKIQALQNIQTIW